jgi:hypothetical protein
MLILVLVLGAVLLLLVLGGLIVVASAVGRFPGPWLELLTAWTLALGLALLAGLACGLVGIVALTLAGIDLRSGGWPQVIDPVSSAVATGLLVGGGATVARLRPWRRHDGGRSEPQWRVRGGIARAGDPPGGVW